MISADQPAGPQVAGRDDRQPRRRAGRVTIIDVTGYTVDAATRELEDLDLHRHATQEDATCATAAAPPT